MGHNDDVGNRSVGYHADPDVIDEKKSVRACVGRGGWKEVQPLNEKKSFDVSVPVCVFFPNFFLFVFCLGFPVFFSPSHSDYLWTNDGWHDNVRMAPTTQRKKFLFFFSHLFLLQLLLLVFYKTVFFSFSQTRYDTNVQFTITFPAYSTLPYISLPASYRRISSLVFTQSHITISIDSTLTKKLLIFVPARVFWSFVSLCWSSFTLSAVTICNVYLSCLFRVVLLPFSFEPRRLYLSPHSPLLSTSFLDAQVYNPLSPPYHPIRTSLYPRLLYCSAIVLVFFTFSFLTVSDPTFCIVYYLVIAL